MLLSLLSGLYRVHGLRVSSLSRCSLTLLASSFFSESVVVFSLSFLLLFHNAFFVLLLLFFCFCFILGLLDISYPLVSLPD